ncbi:phage integrase SAM-like domain-containing protein [Phocaeicola plebeius]|uniref:phage integrase SAM-like domain-containing protein n=1 Tax=Phocaeicola plebeius TaxID=310297 RepID=UPI00350E4D06
MLEVDLDFCRGFINFLRTAKNRRLKSEDRTISNCTGLQTQAVLTAALNTALRDGIIERNPHDPADLQGTLPPAGKQKGLSHHR